MKDDVRAEGGRSVSRRTVLAGTRVILGAGVAVAAASRADAQPSFTQGEAHYQTMPKDSFRCGMCGSFKPPNSCQLVKGIIAPSGWCMYFSLRD